MAIEGQESPPPRKRRKVTSSSTLDVNDDVAPLNSHTLASKRSTPTSLDRPISPPPSRRIRSKTPEPSTPRILKQLMRPVPTPRSEPVLPSAIEDGSETECENEDGSETGVESENGQDYRFLPSPIQLTRIKDLSPSQNVDAVGLGDLLGDPMIKECWNFNYLFDAGFVMEHFDPDVRDLVKVNLVHGFWKNDDERRINLQEASERYPNVEHISAYMPDPFGTHHSKMLILFRHDDHAQVVIHTANMIFRDWANMTQAVWRSPLLPLQTASSKSQGKSIVTHPIGSGERFKTDLLRYLNAYGKRLSELTKHLIQYDFTAIRAAFIGSAPSRQIIASATPSKQTSFGWLGLREILSSIPIQTDPSTSANKTAPNIVIQISSIATLGATPAWLTNFQSVLSKHLSPSAVPATPTFQSAQTFFTKRPAKDPPNLPIPPKLNIIFPTPHEIRTSLDGYTSGDSIHTKLQSAAQQKQLEYLRPLLCHWRHPDTSTASPPRRNAARGPAAPHIKTYIRFHDATQTRIDWAMLTSANLSKQAWGDLENKKGECWIQSWETGVVVWPAVFSCSFPGSDSGEGVEMVPVFGKDMPGPGDVVGVGGETGKTVIGFRMPYDLPLSPYGEDEEPWCATSAYQEPDWKGQVWGGYGS